MKKLTVALTLLLGLAALAIAACTVILDTQSLTEPCTIDSDCKEGFRCEEGTCLPGPRLDAGTLQDAALIDTHVNDAARPDTSVVQDAHVNDSAQHDTRVNDAAAHDTRVEDASHPDTFVEDSAPPEDAASEDTN